MKKICGQFCPVSKASDVLFEKWTMLILREFLMGSKRFSDFQRNISRVSPTILTKRLKTLEKNGLIIRKQQSGQLGYHYVLTPAGKELEPALEHIANWSMRWASGLMSEEAQEVELLMQDVQERLKTEKMPDGENVVLFSFTDLPKHNKWWIWVNGTNVDLCTEDPGKDVDLYIFSDLSTMVQTINGTLDLGAQLTKETIKTHGNKALIKALPNWIGRK